MKMEELNRRSFIGSVAALTGTAALSGCQTTVGATTSRSIGTGAPATTLREAGQQRGVDFGVMLDRRQLRRPDIHSWMGTHFNLVANLGEEIEWDANEAGTPSFSGLNTFLSSAAKASVTPRLRQIYSWEAAPKRAHLRADGSPKSPAELEATLIKRVNQVCDRLNPNSSMTIQVMDEFLEPAGTGPRQDAFGKVLGEGLIETLFYATRERMPRARLTYQDFGMVGDPNNYFRSKTRAHLKLLERLKKKGVPIDGAAIGGFVFPPSNNAPILNASYFNRLADIGIGFHWNELTMIYGKRDSEKRYRPASVAAHDARVIRDYSRVVKFLLQYPNTKEITFFAPIDGDNIVQRGTLGLTPWEGARPGLFTRDLQPKQVYKELLEIAAR